ncbi:MAG: flotillin-like FloA family protein [Pirellulaceae bacterium]|nr:flotillin-like FloA family protein [Pirellulaceae bacterium]
MHPATAFVLGFLTCLLTLVPLAMLWWLFGPWFRAFLSGGQVSLFSIVGMRVRGSPVSLILDAYLALLHGGQKVRLAQVESAFLAHRAKVFTSADLVEVVKANVEQASG